MKKVIPFILFVLLGIAAIGAYLTLFTVHQTQQALVLEFGQPQRVITQPGLKWKVPFIQTVHYLDKRILDLDSSPQEVIASDQKRLMVDAFARYKIVNALLFYQSVRDETRAAGQLGVILEAAMRRVLGANTFITVVRDARDHLMREITQQVNSEAEKYGINIIDVRIKRADLPAENSQAIYHRMQTERQQEAAEIRARGEEQALRIRADADRQATVLRAEAQRDGDTTRGEGDGERNKIYAQAFNQDPDFFAFYRSMEAYEQGLQSKDTRLLLSPNTEFFRYFNNPAGAAPGGGTPAGAPRDGIAPGASAPASPRTSASVP